MEKQRYTDLDLRQMAEVMSYAEPQENYERLKSLLADTRPEPPAEGEERGALTSFQVEDAVKQNSDYKNEPSAKGMIFVNWAGVAERLNSLLTASTPTSPLSEEQVHRAIAKTQAPWNREEAVYYQISNVPALVCELNAALGSVEGQGEKP